MLHGQNDYVYVDIAKDVNTRFDTSNYELERLLPKGKNKKVIGLITIVNIVQRSAGKEDKPTRKVTSYKVVEKIIKNL